MEDKLRTVNIKPKPVVSFTDLSMGRIGIGADVVDHEMLRRLPGSDVTSQSHELCWVLCTLYDRLRGIDVVWVWGSFGTHLLAPKRCHDSFLFLGTIRYGNLIFRTVYNDV